MKAFLKIRHKNKHRQLVVDYGEQFSLQEQLSTQLQPFTTHSLAIGVGSQCSLQQELCNVCQIK